MSQQRVAVVVTPAAGLVRRQVGPQAWVLLEELVARALCDGPGEASVEVTFSELVQSLELSAEVIRSALRRLSDAGLVQRHEQRAPGTRRFATTRYVIVGPTGLTAVTQGAIAALADPDPENPDADIPHAENPDPARPARRDHHRAPAVGVDPQLSLLDLAPSPNGASRSTRKRRERHA